MECNNGGGRERERKRGEVVIEGRGAEREEDKKKDKKEDKTKQGVKEVRREEEEEDKKQQIDQLKVMDEKDTQLGKVCHC